MKGRNLISNRILLQYENYILYESWQNIPFRGFSLVVERVVDSTDWRYRSRYVARAFIQ